MYAQTYQRDGSGTSTDFNIYTSGIITQDAWEHLAIVRDGNTMRLYRGGVQDASGAIDVSGSTSLMTNDLGGKWYIGARAYSQSYGYIHGYLDEYRISDVCRYPDEQLLHLELHQ